MTAKEMFTLAQAKEVLRQEKIAKAKATRMKNLGITTEEELKQAHSAMIVSSRTPEQRKAIASKAARARWDRETSN